MEIVDANSLHTFYADVDDKVKIVCPACHTAKIFDAENYMTTNRGVKAKCSCGNVFRCAIEFRRSYRKSVDFAGDYKNVKSGDKGRMTLESLSLGGVDFINLTSDNLIMTNDVLDISFHLDDKNHTLIQRQIRVISAEKSTISAAFIGARMYDKDLGFYLMI